MSRAVNFGRPQTTSQWWPILRENGKMICSCGRPLVKIHSGLYRCSYGFPQYDIDEGEVAYDKFGGIMIKVKGHNKPRKVKVRE